MIHAQKSSQPIGIFDSGLGGLSVWRELIKILPHESAIYVADSAHCPYGAKSPAQIKKLAKRILKFILTQNPKLIIVACNTISVNTIDYLRCLTPTPIIAIEPATKLAAQNTRTSHIGILATPGTLKGKLYRSTKKQYAAKLNLHPQAVHGLVELIEAGQSNSPKINKILKENINQLTKHNIDQLVLGCTHYPLILPAIKKIINKKITLIDPSPAVAAHAKKQLQRLKLVNQTKKSPAYLFYTTGQPQPLAKFIPRKLLKLSVIHKINI